MISIKTEEEIVLMRGANAIVRDLLLYLEEHIKPGITTKRFVVIPGLICSSRYKRRSLTIAFAPLMRTISSSVLIEIIKHLYNFIKDCGRFIIAVDAL